VDVVAEREVVMADGQQRTWLDVPYADKDAAKALGARWDPTARRWYAARPEQLAAGLERWAPRPELPAVLPGEDCGFGSGLFVDLVPSSCWFTNVRSCVARADWDRLRRMVLGRAAQRCEACDRGPNRESGRWLELHERWAYSDCDPGRGSPVQVLRRLICLCTDCHRVTHLGRVIKVDGEAAAQVAFDHLRAVTGMGDDQANAHVAAAFERWQRRSRIAWTLDLRMLTAAGISVARPPQAVARPAAAAAALRQRQ